MRAAKPCTRKAEALRHFFTTVAVIVAVTGVSAHRLDEYLQATRLAVEPGRVELALDLTPGIAVADAIVADIDRDRDGALSADEKESFVGAVLQAIVLHIDGTALHVEPIAASFPELDAFRQGDATIRIQSAAAFPRLSNGDHQLVYRNTYRRDVSVYLANALVPSSDRIAVTAQRRDADQHGLTIDFRVRAPAAMSTAVSLLGGIAAAMVAAFLALASKRVPFGRARQIDRFTTRQSCL